MTAAVFRPDVLSFRFSPKALQKPLLTPFPYQGHSNVPKLSRHSGKNKKKSHMCGKKFLLFFPGEEVISQK